MEDETITDGMKPVPKPPEQKAREKVISPDEIKDVIERINNEEWSHLNFTRISEKYLETLNGINNSIKSELFYAKQEKDRINNWMGHPDIKGDLDKLTGHPLHSINMHMAKIKTNYEAIISYMGYKLEIMENLYMKVANILKNVEKASEESIRAETMKDNLQSIKDGYSDLFKMTRESMSKLQDSQTDSIKTIVGELAKAMSGMYGTPRPHQKTMVEVPNDGSAQTVNPTVVGLSDLQLKIFEYIKENPDFTNDDLAGFADIQKNTVGLKIAELRKKGLLDKDNKIIGSV